MPIKASIKKIGSWRRNWVRIRDVLHKSLVNFYFEDSLMVSASIAYYSVLSLFPLMLLLLGLGGAIIHRYEFSGQLSLALKRYLPMQPDFIMRNLVGISRAYGRVGLVSFLLLLWSSSGVFLPLEKSLNRAWDVKEGRGWVRRRLLALEMAIILGFIALISSIFMGTNVYIHNLLQHRSSHEVRTLVDIVYHALILFGTFGMTLAMFLILFERLPNRPMRLRQVLPSALLTALFWEAARSLFTLLVPLFNYHHVYGSIGVVVSFMTWAYVSSAVTLFGAQVSRILYGTLKVDVTAETPAPSPPDGR